MKPLIEFTVNVWGWLPENEHEFGGSPEMDDRITVEAISEERALKLACTMFGAKHGFVVVEGEIA
jgi:hypothetical protein